MKKSVPLQRHLPSLIILALLLLSCLGVPRLHAGSWNEGVPLSLSLPQITKIQGPQTPIISASNVTGYSMMATNDNYKVYFKGNSKTPKAIMIQKNGYSFGMDISTSQLHWYSSAYNAIIGMKQEMNPQNTVINTSGNVVTYSGAWINTDLQYSMSVDMLKETLIIHGVSPWSSSIIPDYLQYVTNCYYTNTLTIVADGISYLHPTNQKFTTSGEITFNDPNGKMVFALPVPYVYDSASPSPNAVLGTYAVTANNGILIINIRIPKAFMDSAIYPVYFDPPVRVQGNARGTSAGTTIPVTMAGAPANGNVLVATICILSTTSAVVSSISQAGVTWTYQTSKYWDYSGIRIDAEIWFGVVGAGASADVTVNLSGTASWMGAVANICEYSGVSTSSMLDKTATNTGISVNPDTGTTAETTQASELWIGATCAIYSYTQTTPTNSFSLLDGSYNNPYGFSLAYLEKIVSSIGTASCSTTDGNSDHWVGCIATFKAATTTKNIEETVTGVITIGKTDSKQMGINRGSTGSLTIDKTSGFNKGLNYIISGALTIGKLSALTKGLSQTINAIIDLNSTASINLGKAFSVSINLIFNSSVAKQFGRTFTSTALISFSYATSRLINMQEIISRNIDINALATKTTKAVAIFIEESRGNLFYPVIIILLLVSVFVLLSRRG